MVITLSQLTGQCLGEFLLAKKCTRTPWIALLLPCQIDPTVMRLLPDLYHLDLTLLEELISFEVANPETMVLRSAAYLS